MSRKQLINQLWDWVEPSLEGYSNLIAALVDELTDEQLRRFVEARVAQDQDKEEE